MALQRAHESGNDSALVLHLSPTAIVHVHGDCTVTAIAKNPKLDHDI